MSKSALKSINYSIFELIKKHKDKMSYEHRHGMTGRLKIAAKDLHQLGYVVRNISGLKQKHVSALVGHWQKRGLSVGTIKNRLADFRFVCNALGRSNVIKENNDYSIGSRVMIPTENKAIIDPDFSKIDNQHLRVSLELQRVFGLRREECLKIMPHLADKKDHLWLQGSWTKGRVERKIPILTKEQRLWLNRAKRLTTKSQSLIPNGKSYIHQRNLYNRLTREIGYKNLHGLRHAYAQRRYKELTGWFSPIEGGKSRKELSIAERKIDRWARMIISRDLGHSRVAITRVYLS